jgi:hypothetical protein
LFHIFALMPTSQPITAINTSTTTRGAMNAEERTVAQRRETSRRERFKMKSFFFLLVSTFLFLKAHQIKSRDKLLSTHIHTHRPGCKHYIHTNIHEEKKQTLKKKIVLIDVLSTQ